MKTNFQHTNLTSRRFIRAAGYLLTLALIISGIGCKKSIEVSAPPTSVNHDNVYSNDNGAIQAVTGLYAILSSQTYQTGTVLGATYLNCGLSSDELTLYNTTNVNLTAYYQDNFLAAQPSWGASEHYENIARANDAIEGLSQSTSLTPATKNELLGEAKFLRAFNYFYLVNAWGGVPLILSNDYKKNQSLPRSSVADVYAQIISDLTDAKQLLSATYLGGSLSSTTERTRPNKAASTALLARVYLYMNDYVNAEKQATEVITNAVYSLNDVHTAFLANSNETIWALQPTVADSYNGYNSPEGRLFNLPATGPDLINYPVYLSNALLNTFELGDARRTNWIDSMKTVDGTTYYYPYKYRAGVKQTSVTEYCIVLRLAEQYLIRAEARARQNNITDAVADINVIRTRARAAATSALPNPLPNMSISVSQAQLYAAIEHERQVELFTEWGHRWYDLKRTPGFSNTSLTRADEVMPAICTAKGGTWTARAKLYPIIADDIQLDPNLSQNPGY